MNKKMKTVSKGIWRQQCPTKWQRAPAVDHHYQTCKISQKRNSMLCLQLNRQLWHGGAFPEKARVIHCMKWFDSQQLISDTLSYTKVWGGILRGPSTRNVAKWHGKKYAHHGVVTVFAVLSGPCPGNLPPRSSPPLLLLVPLSTVNGTDDGGVSYEAMRKLTIKAELSEAWIGMLYSFPLPPPSCHQS